MRFFATSMLLAILGGGCSSDGLGRLFFDVGWAVRCDLSGGCTEPVQHSFAQFTGEMGVGGSCQLTPSSGGQVLSFTASDESGAELSLRTAQLSGTCTPTAPCAALTTDICVRVKEGVNEFEGACGAAEPSATQPCRVDGVAFCVREGNPEVLGQIFCRGIEGRVNPSLVREVTAVGSGQAATSAPATFRIANCPGIRTDGLPVCP